MKMRPTKTFAIWITVVLVLSLGYWVQDALSELPPVAAPLVREGAFAMKLAEALNVGHPSSEAEAESMLGAAGIAPRNGWIADYPVSPDIMGEIQDAVGYAAQAKTISMDKDSALKTLEDVKTSVSVSVVPAQSAPPGNQPAETYQTGTAESAPVYPDQTVVNNYYYDQGPPILTYYAPPPDYFYLYGWVPYPFWWGGAWFGGFFILNDFHRHFRDHDHGYFVSNHFNDVRSHRVYRVDPVNRYRSRTFAGIGAPRGSNFIGTGVKGSPERIFNHDRSFGPRPGTGAPRYQSGAAGAGRQPSIGTRKAANPFSAGRVYSRPPGGGRTFTPNRVTPGGGGTTTNRGMSGGGGTSNAPHGGSRDGVRDMKK